MLVGDENGREAHVGSSSTSRGERDLERLMRRAGLAAMDARGGLAHVMWLRVLTLGAERGEACKRIMTAATPWELREWGRR